MKKQLAALLVTVALLLAGGNAPAQTCGMVIIPIKTPVFAGGYQPDSQDLGIAPATVQAIPGRSWGYYEGVYTLKFSVQNYYPTYPGSYDVNVSFGTQQLCEIYGWGKAIVTDVVLKCPAPNFIVIDGFLPDPKQVQPPPQGTQNLVVTFTPGSWQLVVSNVSFTFTPDPAS